MRVVIDIREIQTFPTGIGRYLRGLIYGLQKTPASRQHEFILLTNPDTPDGCVLASGWSIKVVGARPKTVQQHWQLPRELRKEEFDLFLTNPFGYAAFLSRPYAIVILDLINQRYPQLASLKARLYEGLLAKRAAQKAKLILTDSYFSQKDIVNFLKADERKVVVTHLTADPIFHQPQTEEMRQAVRRKFGLEHDFILYVGNRRLHKNLKFLLQVFQHLQAGYLSRRPPLKQVQLVLVGDIDKPADLSRRGQKDEAEQLITRLKIDEQVILTGHISDQELAALYQEALFLAHPALIEGFGLTPLEAMASGCPVLASNAAAIPEVVGEAGILLDPTDLFAWVEAMVKLIGDVSLRQSLREQGLERAKQFSWEKTARQTLDAVSKVV